MTELKIAEPEKCKFSVINWWAHDIRATRVVPYYYTYLISQGYKYVENACEAQFLICGPFHQYSNHFPDEFPGIPRIYILGENMEWWAMHPRVKNGLETSHAVFHTNSNLDMKRLFGEIPKYIWLPHAPEHYDFERIKTRKPLLAKQKSKFCCFCIAHANTALRGIKDRIDIFRYISTNYKGVDSLGAALNNVGGPVPHEGFEEYISKYKFMICFENTYADGYVTEKIARCFVAGVIPIYIGDPKIANYFDQKAFITADPNDPNWMKRILVQVKLYDQTDHLYDKMLAVEPCLDYEVFSREKFCKLIEDEVKAVISK